MPSEPPSPATHPASPSNPSRLRAWFDATHRVPTPAQAAAWPLIEAGHHVLVISPTGTGKTLAAFLAILDPLAREHAEQRLGQGIHALYVSPLRALAHDLEKNLRLPLAGAFGENPPITVALRTGDTSQAERQRQFNHPPHLLLTTPESLGLMLSQERWLPHLSRCRWVVVDEVHALAENKRGSDLSLSLERLALVSAHAPGNGPQRIGLSATVAPAKDVAAFLAGVGRDCRVVEADSAKRIELSVHSPLERDPYPAAGFMGARMMGDLARLIDAHQTTLVFTNTRSGAESATYWLHQQRPDLAPFIECHHGSLDRDLRLDVEDRLKRGQLRAVVCSTSLEMGIDIGSVDLVVMLATPKGVNRALQRAGRAGHSISKVSHGILMATNVGDLVECCATARLARAGHLDPVRIPLAPLDVLAQHLAGMGCIQRCPRAEALALVRRAWPFKDLAQDAFDAVLEYLAGGGKALRAQYTDVFGRIHLDDDAFETRAGNTRRDLLQNIGTIPTEGVIHVVHRNRHLGTVEESFARRLQPGDIFSLAGRPLRLERIDSMECRVTPADGQTPTVPRWGANKFPLANRVAREIREFRRELRQRLESNLPAPALMAWIAQRLDCGPANAAVIHRVHAAQHGVSEIPVPETLLVEQFTEPANMVAARNLPPARPRPSRPSHRALESPPREGQIALASILLPARSPRPPNQVSTPPPSPTQPVGLVGPRLHYFFHSLIGRAANDALSRVVGLRVGRLKGGNPVAAGDDYGFALTVEPGSALAADDIPALLSPEGFAEDLGDVLRRSDLLKYHFRTAAQTGLMVWRNQLGAQKNARKLQWSSEVIFNVLVDHEPSHVLLREARRDAGHAFLDETRARAFLADFDARGRPIRLRVLPRVPPLSFVMYATCIREALMVEDPRETLERLYHEWWNALNPEPGSQPAATDVQPSPG